VAFPLHFQITFVTKGVLLYSHKFVIKAVSRGINNESFYMVVHLIFDIKRKLVCD